MLELLSQLYTSAGHYREAMGVHEEILRLAVEGDDGDDRTTDHITPKIARRHLDLLKRCYQRLGGWDKSPSTYKNIVDELIRMKEYGGSEEWKGVRSVDKWNAKEKADAMGEYVVPKDWELVHRSCMTETGDEREIPLSEKGPRMSLRRAISNWGSELAHQISHSPFHHHQEGKNDKQALVLNGKGQTNGAKEASV